MMPSVAPGARLARGLGGGSLSRANELLCLTLFLMGWG
jgi:hypothetical protein